MTIGRASSVLPSTFLRLKLPFRLLVLFDPAMEPPQQPTTAFHLNNRRRIRRPTLTQASFSLRSYQFH